MVESSCNTKKDDIVSNSYEVVQGVEYWRGGTEENSVMTCEAGKALLDDPLLLEEKYSQVLLWCFHSSLPQTVIARGSTILTNGAKRMASQTLC